MRASVLCGLMMMATLAFGANQDWLLDPSFAKARVVTSKDTTRVVLHNGIVSRAFELGNGVGTVAIEGMVTKTSHLRAACPEGMLKLNGQWFALGGWTDQPNRAFLQESWIKAMSPDPEAFQFVSSGYEPALDFIPWDGRRVKSKYWPPKHQSFQITLEHKSKFPGLIVIVRYRLYDGLPAFEKWIEIENRGNAPLTLDEFKLDVLPVVEAESPVEVPDQWQNLPIEVFSDYSFGGTLSAHMDRSFARWTFDPKYETQVNYERKTPCLLDVSPRLGPGVTLAPGERFKSYRAIEVVHDSTDRERRGLTVRRVTRALAPWTQESPIMLHLTSTDPKTVHNAIDQAAECGFEMAVISFWSGLDMEDLSEANIAKFKGFVDYAHGKGLELGGYSLLASRRVSDEHDVINPKTGKTGGAIFGQSPCLCSKWGQEYFFKIKTFIEKTGFDLLEHDGNYPGDVCASTSHPGHKGLNDSQWRQWEKVRELYAWCRERGTYLNVPDDYFFAGSNKTGMGYRESNWSLPRSQQHIHARQNLFDGTWRKLPTQGWMMVPLVEYQGGGPAATIEPLKEHIRDYEMHLINNFAFGAQACYRGPRLYDSPEVKAMVQKWVAWFKKYRTILEGDVVHLRRANGRDPDAILHVNPSNDVPAMLCVFNPREVPAEEEFEVPLYYSGLRDSVRVGVQDGKASSLLLEEGRVARVKVNIPAKGFQWVVFRR